MSESHRTTTARGLTFLEASAGTGKTHEIAGRVAELVAVDGVPVDEIAVVTFTRAAAGELRERIRRRLVEVRAAVRVDGVPPPHPVPDRLAKRLSDVDDGERSGIAALLQRAVAEVDGATVTTIHGFCQQILAAMPSTAGGPDSLGFAEELGDVIQSAAIDLLVARNLPSADRWPDDVLANIKLAPICNGVTQIFNNPKMELRPRPDDLDAPEDKRRTVELIEAVAVEVESRLERSGRIGHHHLLDLAHRAVSEHPEVVADLRDRFSVVLIDEFQDTDPLQWSIFSQVFLEGTDRHGVVAVGDPKQAIYSFRGGDVGTYLTARSMVPEGERGSLEVNQRSDAAMVEGFNTLFGPVTFGGVEGADGDRSEMIGYQPVDAAERNARSGLIVDGRPLPPIQIRVAAHQRMERTKAGAVESTAANRPIFADVAAHLADLLGAGAQVVTDISENEPSVRALDPSRVAVLCRSRDDCSAAHAALTRLGVPAVIAGSWSIKDTPAFLALRELLWVLSAPGSPGRVNRLAIGPLVGLDALDLVEETADRLNDVHDILLRTVAELVDRGVSSAFALLRKELRLPARLMSRPGGDRLLIDLEHLVELLAADTGDRGTTPDDLAAALADIEVRSSREDEGSAIYRRRSPADGDAVQIMTIHAAKGLEFDVVLCPALHRLAQYGLPYTYSEGVGVERRKIYELRKSGSKPECASPDAAAADKVEKLDEALRVAYVAITRARHRCVIWYPGTDRAPKSPLGTFFGLEGTKIEPHDEPIMAALEARLGHVVAPDGRRVFDIVPIDPDARRHPGVHATPDHRPDVELYVATLGRDLDRRDGRWSFSRLTRHTRVDHVHASSEDPDDPTLGDAGSGDEGPALAIPLTEEVGMGAEFGTLVHETLERTDLSADHLEAELSAALIAAGGPDPDTERHRRIVAGLVQAALTPMGPAFGNLRLVDIAPADHLDEMDFEFSLPPASDAVVAGRLASLIADHLKVGDPLLPWTERLIAAGDDIQLGGFMVGSIDGLFRIRNGSGDPKYVVVDYKTNWLGAYGETLRIDHYSPGRLMTAMAHHHYPLQALIYAVATHRFLRWRLADYDPHVHLGGAAYLFLRGMVGAETPREGDNPYGVASWRMPADLVTEASDLLAHLGGETP